MRALRSSVVVLAASAALVAAGCGGDDNSGGSSSSSSTGTGSGSSQQSTSSSSAASGAPVAVKLSEFKITPATPKVAKGTVTFDLSNTGKFPHAITIDGPSGAKTSAILQGGQSGKFKVDLSKPGTYTWFCPVDGHRQQGMVGKVTVT